MIRIVFYITASILMVVGSIAYFIQPQILNALDGALTSISCITCLFMLEKNITYKTYNNVTTIRISFLILPLGLTFLATLYSLAYSTHIIW